MSLIHQAQAKKRREEKLEKATDDDCSPVRTVLGSLAGDSSIHPSRKSSMAVSKDPVLDRRRKSGRKPQSIEEVPFRRQDQRTLNAKKRRDMDKKLILFIVSCGLFLIITGTLLLIIYNFYQAEYKDVRPAIVIGKISRNLVSTTGAGAAKLIFSGPVL